mmetsp:Transcript_30119/g.93183  ORF Transcript_30119/g.93183 Transcript_30119/m.93183 type:complete len:232 (-) Transcript_30119:43-738(-)
MPLIVRIRVPTFEDRDKATVYPIEVTYDTGKTRRVTKRYRDVLDFHGTLLKAAPHAELEDFRFPNKSLFHNSADFTKERRRSGFEEYFELLLRLGAPYAPFLVAFLRHGEGAVTFDELGEAGMPSEASPASAFIPDLDADDAADGPSPRPALKLARARSAAEWLVAFYLPAALLAGAYARLLTAVGALNDADWRNGPAWLAVATAPVVLGLGLALLGPLCDDDPELAATPE